MQARGVAGHERVAVSHGLNDCEQARQQLELPADDRAALIAFLRTL